MTFLFLQLYLLFRLLNPSISRMDKAREKQVKKELAERQFESVEVYYYYN